MTGTPVGGSAYAEAARPLKIETNGIDVIGDADRKGRPAAALLAVVRRERVASGLSYGSFAARLRHLASGRPWSPASIGIVVSFLLCGLIAIAGKRGSAPTWCSAGPRSASAATGVPSVLSWLLTVGWETVLVVAGDAGDRDRSSTSSGWGGGTATKVVALVVVALVVIGGGVLGFDLIMRMQTVITVVTGVLTVGYIVLVVDHIDWSRRRAPCPRLHRRRSSARWCSS